MRDIHVNGAFVFALGAFVFTVSTLVLGSRSFPGEGLSRSMQAGTITVYTSTADTDGADRIYAGDGDVIHAGLYDTVYLNSTVVKSSGQIVNGTVSDTTTSGTYTYPETTTTAGTYDTTNTTSYTTYTTGTTYTDPYAVTTTTYTVPTTTTTTYTPPTTTTTTSFPTTDDTFYVRCPIEPRTNQTIIDLTKGGTVPVRELYIFANKAETDATRYLAKTLSTGVYKVTLASFDDRKFETGPDSGEKWKLAAFDSTGKVIDETPPTRDLPDDLTGTIELVDSEFTISRSVVRFAAKHALFPSSESHAFAVLCAGVERVADVPTITTQVAATTTTVVTTTTTSASTTPLFTGQYERCPISEREGRRIVDFTKGGTVPLDKLAVRADGDKLAATKGPIPISLPRGTYSVRLASFGGSASTQTWEDERWQAVLFDSSGTMVARTPASRDVPEYERVFPSLVSEKFELKHDIVRVAAQHATYPSTVSSPFAVLCAAFDLVGSLEGVSVASATTSVVNTTVAPTIQATASPDDTNVSSTGQLSTESSLSSTNTTNAGTVSPSPASGSGAMSTNMTVVRTNTGTPSGAGETATPIRTALVAVNDIGVDSTQDTIAVPEHIVESRKRVVETVGERPFELLAQSTQRERNELITRIVEAAASIDTPASTSTGDRPVAPAMSTDRVTEETTPTPSDTARDEEHRERVAAITGPRNLSAIRDSDGDGVSDHDEERIYGTDPLNPFTAGSVLTDGERLLLGFDPRSTSLEPVVVESPKLAGDTVQGLYEVETIAYATPTDSTVRSSTGTPAPVRVTGRAKPYAFLTLYVYSTPIIVTVRADGAGRFEYAFDETLGDGSHNLYVTNVDASGKILAKSDPIPFVKTAQAIEYTPASSPVSPTEGSMSTMATLALLLFFIAAVGSIILIGMRHSAPTTEPQ